MKPGGFCRAKPPSVFMVGIGKNLMNEQVPLAGSYFPQISDIEWCGYWAPLTTPAQLPKIDLEKLGTDELAGSS